MGYFRSRNFRITHAKLNFEGFIFVHFQLQDNLSIRDLLSKSFIFEGVALFEIFENKTPSKITRYTVIEIQYCHVITVFHVINVLASYINYVLGFRDSISQQIAIGVWSLSMCPVQISRYIKTVN